MPLRDLVVLAVDDNPCHNYALSRTLEKHGHCSVLSASTGQQALDIAFSQVPDAILLDVNLPDLNGWEVCRRLRADDRLKHVAIIFLTATFQSTSAKELATGVGADNLLFYPVEKGQLFAVITGEVTKAKLRG